MATVESDPTSNPPPQDDPVSTEVKRTVEKYPEDESSEKDDLKRRKTEEALKEKKEEEKAKPALGFSSFSSSNPFAAASGSSTVFGSTLSSSKESQDKIPTNVFQTGLAEDKEELPEENDEDNRNNQLFSSTPLVKLDEVKVISGEEEETCVFQVRAKLYKLQKQESPNEKSAEDDAEHLKFRGEIKEQTDVQKEESNATSSPAHPQYGWKELGVGALHVNEPKERSNADKLPRLVMRRDGVMSLVLNCYLWPSLPLEKASDRTIRFTTPEIKSNPEKSASASTTTYLLKLRRDDECTELFETLLELKVRYSQNSEK